MKKYRYSVNFKYPEGRDNEYRFDASSEKSAVSKAAAWHVKIIEAEGHAVWGHDDDPSNPHFLSALGVSVTVLPPTLISSLHLE